MAVRQMIVVEWLSAACLLLSIVWYVEQRGIMSVAAPALSIIGCLGFFVTAMYAGLYGVAALNFTLCLVNARNLGIMYGRWRRGD